MSTKKKYGMSLSQMQANLDTAMRYDSYFAFFLCADEMMFEWSGLPDTIEQKYLEDYLNISGSAGIAMHEGKLYASPYAGRTGKTDQYGQGTEIDTETPGGYPVRGVLGEDAAVIYNNTARFPQTDLIFDSMELTEIDKSGHSNVIFARIAPLLSCSDDKTIEAVKGILENVIAGNLEAVVSENIPDMLGFGQTDGLKSIDVFDHPERVQYLQYLSQFWDVLMRRHFSKRGLTMRTPTKAAQQSTDEIHGLDSVSWFYPLNKLKARQDGAAEVNRIFGTNITVKFSDIWEQEYQAYLLRILQADTEAENKTEEVKNNVVSSDSSSDSADSSGEADTDSP